MIDDDEMARADIKSQGQCIIRSIETFITQRGNLCSMLILSLLFPSRHGVHGPLIAKQYL